MVDSAIYVSEVTHTRHHPVRHHFEYKLYLYCFDLAELEMLDEKHLWFGYNKFRPIAIHDKDYLAEGEKSLKEKTFDLLAKFDNDTSQVNRILLVTGARFFNYVFNPVSFFYCYDRLGSLLYIIVEINNTFDERHVYIIRESDLTEIELSGRRYKKASRGKCFHVSPFYDMQGDYEFYFSELAQEFDIRINISRNGETTFNSRLKGKSLPLNNVNLTSVLLRFPLSAVLSYSRILWQAGKLYYLKKLPVFKKPAPSSEFTIKIAKPTAFEKLTMKIVFEMLEGIRHGSLKLRLPDGTERTFGDQTSSSRHDLEVLDYDFFWKVVSRGPVGFGESYADGYCRSEDLTGLIAFSIDNRDMLHESKFRLAGAARTMNRFRHSLRKNSKKGSRENIASHYDLGNDFYKLILDPSMSYSCAMYESPGENLESAQLRKIDRIIDKARIEEGAHLLEIGSGWGSLACRAVESRKCQVTSITLSREQLEYATHKAAAEGKSDAINFKYLDYRELSGTYDRIVSVEMLEAVGEKYLGEFFKTCDRVLSENGLVVLQVITMPEDNFKYYRKSSDWIQKYIFPGAFIPSLHSLNQAIRKNSAFIIESIDNIGPHYAPTLKAWKQNLMNHAEQIKKLGFDDRFIRRWDYYFSYCEAAFKTRTLNNLQIVLTRPNNRFLRSKDAL